MNAEKRNWADATLEAIQRVVDRQDGNVLFTLKRLTAEELNVIVQVTRSHGNTPDRTLQRVLQDLRDLGYIRFHNRGQYEFLGTPKFNPTVISTNVKRRVTWKQATFDAITRLLDTTQRSTFNFKELLDQALPRIVEETQSRSKQTPAQLQSALRALVSDGKLVHLNKSYMLV